MFQGFFPETIDFLWSLRFNNDRDWFAAHKPVYKTYLLEPMKALAAQVSEPFLGESGRKLHLSRIYRDMRMRPTTFYKDSLWFCIQYPGESWLGEPSLCFEIKPEGYNFGFLFWNARPAQMKALRAKMAAAPDPFLAMITEAQETSGLTLDGSRYKYPPTVCPDARLEPYFSLRNLYALCERQPDRLLFSPQLAEELTRVFSCWLPVLEFCHKS